MYIEPNTTIKIYSGVPLDNTYTNQLYFESISHQRQYFDLTNKLKYTLSSQSYQRVERGRMRIEKKADELYDCNYLAFQNTNYGNKWFYAFITGVEYINNVTSEVTFEIDTVQTYMFDIELKDSFVEREHSVTDDIGDSITAENVSIGEYVQSDEGELMSDLEAATLRGTRTAIMVTSNSLPQGGDGVATIEQVTSGFALYIFDSSDTDGIDAVINNYTQSPDNILMMYMLPAAAFPYPEQGGSLVRGHSVGNVTKRPSLTLRGNEPFGNYVPKNKKLYTYPYNFLNLTDGGASNLAIRFEFCKKNQDGTITPKFNVAANIMPPVKVVIRPTDYKGIEQGALDLYRGVSKTESLTLEGYPYCSWNYDFYKTWLAQNVLSQVISGIGTAIGVGASAVTGHRGSAVMQGIKGVSDLITNHYEASIHADVVKGNASNSNINFSSGMLSAWYSRFHITEEYARMIDNFFTMYGYATNKVKTPSFANRPHWTYVKTNGCTAIGKAPADEIRRFCSIIDNGITFWRTPSEVGDYSLDNSPV